MHNLEVNKRLQKAAEQLAIEINSDQKEKISIYLEQLNKWNRTYNLTAIRDMDQMLIQHVFDSMAVVPYIKKILDKNTANTPVIVDVGSGGGLPGVVLAIMNLGFVHCVDAVEKKMSFVQQVAGVLHLKNLQAHQARIEDLDPFQADIVISRAFSSLEIFVNLASKHVSEYGYLLAMKGQIPEEEIEQMITNTSWSVKEIKKLQVPELSANRCLVSLHYEGKS